jgi:membrane protein
MEAAARATRIMLPPLVERVLRIAMLLVRRSLQDDLPAMASALAYKTLLGLIPILVVVTLVAKTLMGAEFAPFVAGFIESLGLDSMKIVPPADGATTAGTGPVELGSWVEGLVKQASEIDLSALGWVGVAVTVGSAIWLMTSIELSFNRVCRARAGRSWVKRVVLYWFVLTATPLLLAAIPFLSSRLSALSGTPGIGVLVALARTVWDVGVLWALLLLVYVVVPAGRIRAPFAAIGALTAAAVIIALKGLLAAYFEHAFAMSRLYGSLGLVPVFMFWLWVVWMAALLGLEIGALAQTIRLRGLDAGMSSNDGAAPDPAVAVAVMDAAVIAWRAGAHVDRQAIAQRLSIDDRLAGEMLESLARGGFLDRTEGDAYLPSRPPETIPVADVLRWTQRGCAGEDAVERSAPARAIRGAQEDAARHQTLA